MRSNIFLAVGSILLLFASCGQGTGGGLKEKDSVIVENPVDSVVAYDLQETINGFVAAYVLCDNKKVNSFIHPEYGLVVIYRPGVADSFERVAHIDFSKPVPYYYSYSEISNDYVLKFERLPEFDCGTEKWDKLGLFCDTLTHPDQVSRIIIFESEFEVNKHPEKELKNILKDEKESFRVVLTAESPLIFHVQKIDGRWYVTTLDRAYGGCDA